MIKKCGGNALWIPDGYAAFGALKKLMQSSYEQTRSLAIALTALWTASRAEKAGILSFGTKRRRFCRDQRALFFLFPDVLEMDHYAVPLPFSTVTGGQSGLRESQQAHDPGASGHGGSFRCPGSGYGSGIPILRYIAPDK